MRFWMLSIFASMATACMPSQQKAALHWSHPMINRADYATSAAYWTAVFDKIQGWLDEMNAAEADDAARAREALRDVVPVLSTSDVA